MRSLSLAQAKAKLSEVVNVAEHKSERVLIKKRNTPAAVVIGYEDYRKLKSIEDLYESRLLEEAIRGDTVYTLEDVTKRVGVEL